MPHSSCIRLLRLYPPSPRLALLQPTHYGRHRPSHRAQRLDGRTRPDRRRVDLQGQRGEEGLPHGPLGQRGPAPVCVCWVYQYALLLRLEK